MLDKQIKNKISIYGVQINRLKNRNGRQEIRLYGKNNKLEYEIFMWFSESYFTNVDIARKSKSKKGIRYKLELTKGGYFNLYIHIKDNLPELKKVLSLNKYYEVDYKKINKFLGIEVKFKILNKYLKNVHPSLKMPWFYNEKKTQYSYNTFYSGGGCSPK